MAESRFTKQEADHILEIVDTLFEAIPKSKRYAYLGELNDVCLFIEAAKREAPES